MDLTDDDSAVFAGFFLPEEWNGDAGFGDLDSEIADGAERLVVKGWHFRSKGFEDAVK